MKCWICGEREADSREHIVRASDLRKLFGDINPERPVFLTTAEGESRKVQSAKSRSVKTGKVICRRCNDTQTAPYDRAWSALLSSFLANWQLIETSRRYKAQAEFPGRVHRTLNHVHLHFVKLLGCRIVDEGTPIDIRPFAKAILNGEPHPEVYLVFVCEYPRRGVPTNITVMDITRKNPVGGIEVVGYYYVIGRVGIQVMWFSGKPERNVPGAWHPSDRSKIIKFRGRWL